MKISSCLITAIFFLPLCEFVEGQPLPTPPLVVNCGPQTDEAALMLAETREVRQLDAHRLVHLPDMRYRRSSGYGHHIGEGYRHWHGSCRPSMGHHWETDLFASGRVAPKNYTFDVPSGTYYVSIGICEGEAHVAGQRVFDVLANDTVIAQNIDPIAMAGYKEPLMLTALVDVGSDRKLNVALNRKSERRPIVSAIWVVPAYPADTKTAARRDAEPPTNIQAVGSYDANLVSWHRPKDYSIAGFSVRRRIAKSNGFEVVTPNPIYCHRWIDRDVEVGRSYEYQIGSINTQGRTTWSDVITSASPRSPATSTLPRYSIHLATEATRRMLASIHEDHVQRAEFTFQNQSYPIEIRIRGASTRHAAKKSYRIRFTGDCPFPRKVIFLKAEAMDHTMQQEKLSCDLFRAAGAIVSDAAYVNLFINDHYEGVYLDIEPIRSPFKKTKNLDPAGTLIRASTFQHMRALDEIGELRGSVGNLKQLRDFIQQINRTPRGEFEQFIRQHTDWPRVRDYLALIVLTHRTEIEANDYFFYCAPKTSRWSLIPWDHNNGNFHVRAYQNRIGEPFIHVFPQTVQQLGWRPDYWYVLPSRIFQTPVLRREYLNRLEELTRAWLISGRLDSMIDENLKQLRTEYPLDPHRWPFAEVDPFERSADELKRFVRQHAAQILEQIQAERNREASPVVINEFAFGKENGWIELHNRSQQNQSLRSMYLVTKNQAGNWQLSLSSHSVLQPDEYRMIPIPHRPVRMPRFSDAEARERWELESRHDGRQGVFPGYSPDGGFLGLVRQEPRRDADREWEDDERRERVMDFYFYGPQQPGSSYGRTETGFKFQDPSPGRKNRL